MRTHLYYFWHRSGHFEKELLIPLLKKSNIDPGIPKQYCPVTRSSTFSKLLEVYTLEESGDHTYQDREFDFIKNRGTNMAVSLTYDVSAVRIIAIGTIGLSCRTIAQ